MRFTSLFLLCGMTACVDDWKGTFGGGPGGGSYQVVNDVSSFYDDGNSSNASSLGAPTCFAHFEFDGITGTAGVNTLEVGGNGYLPDTSGYWLASTSATNKRPSDQFRAGGLASWGLDLTSLSSINVDQGLYFYVTKEYRDPNGDGDGDPYTYAEGTVSSCSEYNDGATYFELGNDASMRRETPPPPPQANSGATFRLAWAPGLSGLRENGLRAVFPMRHEGDGPLQGAVVRMMKVLDAPDEGTRLVVGGVDLGRLYVGDVVELDAGLSVAGGWQSDGPLTFATKLSVPEDFASEAPRWKLPASLSAASLFWLGTQPVYVELRQGNPVLVMPGSDLVLGVGDEGVWKAGEFYVEVETSFSGSDLVLDVTAMQGDETLLSGVYTFQAL